VFWYNNLRAIASDHLTWSAEGQGQEHSKTQEPEIIQAALVILESIVLNSTGKCTQVEKEITFPNLVVRLEYPNSVVQQNALALINALLLKADTSKRKHIAATLWSKQVRHVLLTKIIESDQVQHNNSFFYLACTRTGLKRGFNVADQS
jgi:hypothetical protein